MSSLSVRCIFTFIFREHSPSLELDQSLGVLLLQIRVDRIVDSHRIEGQRDRQQVKDLLVLFGDLFVVFVVVVVIIAKGTSFKIDYNDSLSTISLSRDRVGAWSMVRVRWM